VRCRTVAVVVLVTVAGSCGGDGGGTTPNERRVAGDEQRSAPVVGDSRREPVEPFVRDCASRVEGGRLRPDLARDVRVGPVIFYGLREAAAAPMRDFAAPPRLGRAWKTVTEVRAATRVTVTISPPDRRAAVLLYGNFDRMNRQGMWKLTDGAAAVRFEACPPDQPRFSGRGPVGRRTQFNGGFLTNGARCIVVEARVLGEEGSFRRDVSFGTRGAGCRER
jgi:hypothetical protein